MATRKQQHVAVNRPNLTNYMIRPAANLLWRLSPRTAVAKQVPVRPLLVNVHRAATFILAVVPFQQTSIYLRLFPESSQFAGAHRALQRTCEHRCECQPSQSLAKAASISFAALSKWQIGQ